MEVVRIKQLLLAKYTALRYFFASQKKPLLILLYALSYYFVKGYAAGIINLKYSLEITEKAYWIIDCINDLLVAQLILFLAKPIKTWLWLVLIFINGIALNWLFESFTMQYKSGFTEFDYTEIFSTVITLVIVWWKWRKVKP